MTEARLTKFQGHDVRVVKTTEEEEPVVWFHLGDVSRILEIKNPRDIAAKLRNIDEGAGVARFDARNLRGEMRPTSFVKEEFLYFDVIPRSKKPVARAFTRWARNVLKDAVRQARPPLGQMQQLAIAARNAATESQKVLLRAMDVFRGDARVCQHIRDSFMNAYPIPSGSLALPAPLLLGVSEILEEAGWTRKDVLRLRISVGRAVAREYRIRYKRKDAQTSIKLVNGHSVKVKIYESVDHPWILQIAEGVRGRDT